MTKKQISLLAVFFLTICLESSGFSQAVPPPGTISAPSPLEFAPLTSTPQPPPRSFAVQQNPATPQNTVKVHVVVSKLEGDKKISSQPYTISVVPGQSASLRLGSEVPVPTTSTGAGNTTSYTLQQSGIQVDANLSPTPEGKYKLSLTITDRSQSGTRDVGALKVPIFSNRVTASNVILGDGQSTQFTSGLDGVTGETWTVDVTLNVEK